MKIVLDIDEETIAELKDRFNLGPGNSKDTIEQIEYELGQFIEETFVEDGE